MVTLTPKIIYPDPNLPGGEPERFGEGFFSGEFHSAPVFSPDMKTVWWGGEYGSATIYTSQFGPDAWTEPATIQFSEEINSYRDPFISPDGTMFYFISTAAIPGSPSTGKENIWMMEKQGEGWGEPQPLPASINTLSLHWTISVDDNYNLYFSAQKDGNTDIFLSSYVEGMYTEPIRLDAPINTEAIELTPNIAPDESYLLFTRIASRTDPPHLYISYALDSAWSDPIRVDNIPYCISPIVTPDRSFVIYLSSPASFEWRDTSFIEELRP
jgi:Tol biopolymer transport system component